MTPERALDELENCIRRYGEKCIIKASGLDEEELRRLRAGGRLFEEKELYSLLEALKHISPLGSVKHRPQFHGVRARFPYWELVGLLVPNFCLEKSSGEIFEEKVQALLDVPDAIIDDPDLPIEEGNFLVHTLPNGISERLRIEGMEYHPYEKTKPAYHLQVKRWRPGMDNHNTQSFINNGNINMGEHSYLGGNVIGNSTNTYNENPSVIFAEARKLIESLEVNYREELNNVLTALEKAYTSGNKKEEKAGWEKWLALLGPADKLIEFGMLLAKRFM